MPERGRVVRVHATAAKTFTSSVRRTATITSSGSIRAIRSILLEGNDGGATVSTDGGETWSSEHNQPTGQFYHVALDDAISVSHLRRAAGRRLDRGPECVADGLVPLSAWQRAAYGESTFVASQPDDPDVTYGSGYFSIFLRYDANDAAV